MKKRVAEFLWGHETFFRFCRNPDVETVRRGQPHPQESRREGSRDPGAEIEGQVCRGPDKFTVRDAEAVVRKWGVHLRDFPRGADDRADIAESLIEMVVSKTALEWLRDAVISTGRLICFAELRGIYCTRYRPLDGIEGSASIAIGYRPKDQEMRAIKAHGEMKLLPPSPPDPEIQTVQACRLTG